MTEAGRSPADTALTVLALLAVLYTVHVAREVLLPITLALIFALLFTPVIERLVAWRLPRALASLLVIASTLLAVGSGLYLLSSSAIGWLQRLPEAQEVIQRHMMDMQHEVAEVDAAARNLEALAEGMTADRSGPAPQAVIIKAGWRDELWLGLKNFALFGGLSVILLFFLLTAGDEMLRAIIERMPGREEKQRLREIARRAQQQMSRYLVTVTAVNGTVGLITGLVLWLLDFPDPALWGTLAGALRFVPYLGVSLTVILLASVAAISVDSMALMAGIPLGYLLLTSFVGQVVDPFVHGHRFSLNPIIVFVWIFFWGWLWGAPGVLLAVPLLTLFQVVCEHSERLAPLAHIMSSGTAQAGARRAN